MALSPEEFESRLLQWEIDPQEDLGIPAYLVEACQKIGQKHIREAEKKGENLPLKKLLNWPGEACLTEALQEAMNLHPIYHESMESEETRREFLEEANALVWSKLCQGISETEVAKIEQEVEISYITQEISKVIKLEQYYTSLKPLGSLFWERASHELRSLVDDDSLIYITEEPNILQSKKNPGAKREIPNWVRGIILARSLQGTAGTKESLNPQTRTKPDANAFRTAALWALQDHLAVGGKSQHLEDTVETFGALNRKRKRVKLDLRIIPADEIIPEVEITPPLGRDGENYPWLLCWGFLPNTDQEVRELAEAWKAKGKSQNSIHSQYKHRMLQRTLNFIAKLNLLATYEARATIRENYMAKQGVRAPIMEYLKMRIPQENQLLFALIFTESVWKQFAPLSKA